MKINKKGLSMVELIVCIVLISIVLLFMFQLLSEVRSETDSNSYVYNNQLNRIDSLYKVARELHQQKDPISGITTTGNLVTFHFKSNKTTNMKITQEGNKYYIDYKDYEGNNNRWEMKNAKIDSCGQYTIGKYGNSTNGKYYFKLNFYVYNAMDHSLNNKDNNNLVDDLELVFTGEIKDINNSISNNILSKSNGTYNIGTCA